MPCLTSYLLRNLQFLDLSDNLLTDMTLAETLCDGDSPLKDLRVLNVSGNALKVASGRSLGRSRGSCGPAELFVPVLQSVSSTSRLLAGFLRLSHLDVSRNAYGSLAPACSWPASLRYLNLSRTRMASVSPCLPAALQVGPAPIRDHAPSQGPAHTTPARLCRFWT